MLRTMASLYECTVAACDGDIGTVEQAYFDDEAWGVRYLVVNTGSWIDKRQVLISPYSVNRVDPGSGAVHTNLTRRQVRDSPNIDTDKPVSRQHETQHIDYYNYPRYWEGAYLWGHGAYPVFASMAATQCVASAEARRDADNPPADVHLRSTKAVNGYHIEATNGTIGHVCGFIFDDVAWAIRYLIVDTRNGWPGGKEVLLATQWLDLAEWKGPIISTTLTRDAIKNAPEYDGSLPLSRQYEEALHEHYGKGGYWSEDGAGLEVFEKIGTREFSAILKPDASVIIKEGTREFAVVTLTSGIPALAEHRDGPAILESTIAELLHALIQEYARVI
jgi:hypothetical protein